MILLVKSLIYTYSNRGNDWLRGRNTSPVTLNLELEQKMVGASHLASLGSPITSSPGELTLSYPPGA